MPDGQNDPHASDWRTLTPAQRNALAWRLARTAQAARARAIGEAVRAAVSRLIGRSTSAFASAGLPASAALASAPVAPRGREFLPCHLYR